jgi:hypothetical protein
MSVTSDCADVASLTPSFLRDAVESVFALHGPEVSLSSLGLHDGVTAALEIVSEYLSFAWTKLQADFFDVTPW